MCKQRLYLANGLEGNCGVCSECRNKVVNDWVGRCVAEARYATETWTVTLTYGRDKNIRGAVHHPRSVMLVYSDIQKYLKKLRIAGYKVRYFAAGEYGSAKGRAHWHVVLFFDGAVPPHTVRQNYTDDFWEHGFQYWREAKDSAGIRYACKYIVPVDGEQRASIHMSTQPFIGERYIDELAQKYVDAGLSPQNAYYKFEECRLPTGELFRFRLYGSPLRFYFQRFMEKWEQKYGNHKWPYSQYLEDWLDRNAKYVRDGVRRERRIELPFRGARPRFGFDPERPGRKVRSLYCQDDIGTWWLRPYGSSTSGAMRWERESGSLHTPSEKLLLKNRGDWMWIHSGTQPVTFPIQPHSRIGRQGDTYKSLKGITLPVVHWHREMNTGKE